MAKDNGAGNGNGKPTTTTAIGPTIVIKGKLRSDEDLIVKGRVEAEISSSKALLVENSGIIKANIKVKSARISGVLVGNVTAEERVEIAPDGRMVGDLTAPKIIINDGAAFRGQPLEQDLLPVAQLHTSVRGLGYRQEPVDVVHVLHNESR